MKFYSDDKQTTCGLQNHSNIKLSDLLEKSKALQNLQAIFNSFVDDALAKHCIVANYKKETLVLLTDSASWSTKIRFMEPTLLNQLKTNKIFAGIKKIKCKVRPKENEISYTKKHKLIVISDKNASMIKATAKTIKNKRLRESLMRLAKSVSDIR